MEHLPGAEEVRRQEAVLPWSGGGEETVVCTYLEWWKRTDRTALVQKLTSGKEPEGFIAYILQTDLAWILWILEIMSMPEFDIVQTWTLMHGPNTPKCPEFS